MPSYTSLTALGAAEFRGTFMLTRQSPNSLKSPPLEPLQRAPKIVAESSTDDTPSIR